MTPEQLSAYLMDGELFLDKDGKVISPMAVKLDLMRGTGRTTAGMLRVIALALETPGQWVSFIDHADNGSLALRYKEKRLQCLVDSLDLKISVRYPQNYNIEVRSNSCELRKGMTKEQLADDTAEDKLWGTGRTTAGILRAMAYALENPDKWVPFTDHAGQSWRSLFNQCVAIKSQIALRIDIKGNDVDGIMLRSPITQLRQELVADQFAAIDDCIADLQRTSLDTDQANGLPHGRPLTEAAKRAVQNNLKFRRQMQRKPVEAAADGWYVCYADGERIPGLGPIQLPPDAVVVREGDLAFFNASGNVVYRGF